jgi:hypothetical protein
MKAVGSRGVSLRKGGSQWAGSKCGTSLVTPPAGSGRTAANVSLPLQTHLVIVIHEREMRKRPKPLI